MLKLLQAIFSKRRLERAEAFAQPLETYTNKGLLDFQDLHKGVYLTTWKDGAPAVNRLRKIERQKKTGNFYQVNGVLMYGDQSIVANGNVTHVKLLKIGDKLVGLKGKEIELTSLKKLSGTHVFYRLTVSGDHTYYINGILCHNASRFWVGGTGTWDNSSTTHWASTSGGSSGASNPTTSDDCTFDGNSGGGTVTPNYNVSVNSISMGAFTGTLDWSANNNSPTMATFNNTGTAVRTLNMGSGNTLTITGNATTVWSMGTVTNLTFNAGTAVVKFTYSGSVGTRTITSITPARLAKVWVSAGSDTITTGNTSVKDLDFTGFTGIWGNSTTNISGNVTLGSGMTTESNTAVTTLSATSGTQTWTSNGVAFRRPLTQDGVGGTVSFADTFTLDPARTYTFTNGTFQANAKTLNMGSFSSSNNNVRTIDLTNATINLTRTASGTAWTTDNGSGGVAGANLTLTVTGSTINITGVTSGTTADIGFAGGGKTYNNVVFNGPTRGNVSYSSTFANLSFLGTSDKECRWNVAVDQTVTGTYTITGASQTARILALGAGTGFEGTQRTVTAAAVSFSDVDFQDMRILGAASPASGTRLGDCFNNTNINFASPRTLYWIGGTGNFTDASHWSTSSGGSATTEPPRPQDTLILDANSTTGAGNTLTFDGCRTGVSIDMSAITNNPTIAMRSSNVQGTSFYGNVVWSPNVTVTGNDNFELCSRTTANFDPGGITWPNSVVIRAANGGIITQTGHNFISSAGTGFTIALGKFVANGFSNQTSTVTIGTFSSGSGRNQAIDWGSGTWSLTTTATATVLNITSAGLVSTPGTGWIKITGTSNNIQTLAGGGYSLPGLWISGSGSRTVSITGNNTWVDFKSDMPNAYTIQFAASSTQTFTNASTSLNGSAGNVITLQSSSAGTAWNISCASGLFQVRYCSIKDSAAAGGASFSALNSTSVSGNSGWVFGTLNFSALTETAITLAESFSKSDSRTMTESVTITESFVRGRILGEVITITESFSKSINRTFTESAISVVDSMLKVSQAPLTDTITLADTLIGRYVTQMLKKARIVLTSRSNKYNL